MRRNPKLDGAMVPSTTFGNIRGNTSGPCILWLENGSRAGSFALTKRGTISEVGFKPYYIVQEILGLPPLMDDHQGAQKVISDPSFIWLRTLVLKLAETNQIPIKMRAGQIGDFCELQGITIPSLNDGADQKKRNQHIGTLLGKIFEKPDYPEEDMVTVEEYRVRRQQIPGTKHGTEKSYLFNKSPLHALLLDSP